MTQEQPRVPPQDGSNYTDRDGLKHPHRLPARGVPCSSLSGSTIDFSETPFRPHRPPPPRIGEDTKEILAWLGVDEARMAALKDEGVVQLARRELRGGLVTRASFEADLGTRSHWSASVMGGGFRA